MKMDDYRQQKIHKYEDFVDRRLKPDLVRAIAERDKVFEQQKIFSDLQKNIENLEKNSITSLRTPAGYKNHNRGYRMDFMPSSHETLSYISQREEKLSRQIEEYTRLIASIKVQIKRVCDGIQELLDFPGERPIPERNF